MIVEIAIAAVTISLVVVAEVLMRQKKSQFNLKYSQVQYLDNRIEITKEISHLLSSKTNSFNADLGRLVLSFFKQNKYIFLRLLILKQIYRYSKDNQSSISSSELTDMEKFLISHHQTGQMQIFQPLEKVIEDNNLKVTGEELSWRMITLLPLVYEGVNKGYLFIPSETPEILSKEEQEFLQTVANFISILLKRYEYNDLLSFPQQLKATNIPW